MTTTVKNKHKVSPKATTTIIAQPKNIICAMLQSQRYMQYYILYFVCFVFLLKCEEHYENLKKQCLYVCGLPYYRIRFTICSSESLTYLLGNVPHALTCVCGCSNPLIVCTSYGCSCIYVYIRCHKSWCCSVAPLRW